MREDQGPVVGQVDNAIYWVNLFPVDNTMHFPIYLRGSMAIPCEIEVATITVDGTAILEIKATITLPF